MYRVYDNELKKFIYDGAFIAQNDDLYMSKRGLFGNEKLVLVPDMRYTYHMAIGLQDSKGNEIFEGDICRANEENGNMIGVISYIPHQASYCFADYERNYLYPLTTKVCRDYLEIIGNVFETPELINKKEESNE